MVVVDQNEKNEVVEDRVVDHLVQENVSVQMIFATNAEVYIFTEGGGGDLIRTFPAVPIHSWPFGMVANGIFPLVFISI
jgi:hypothetical protein